MERDPNEQSQGPKDKADDEGVQPLDGQTDPPPTDPGHGSGPGKDGQGGGG